MSMQAKRATSAITVTKPLLPDVDSIVPLLREAFGRGWVTNNGRYVQDLEARLAEHLGTQQVLLVTNATVGLDIAVRAAVEEGEVITTGYSFPATYHVLLNNPKLTPVFADIDETFCLDPREVARCITPRTRAILAVHTYGYPCNHDALSRLARENGLKLLYDAAPAFGVTLGGTGVAAMGDLSVFSFHATKVFSTLEGGGITSGSDDPALLERVRLLRNFGIQSEEEILSFGVNGKMDEVRAIVGLQTLPLVAEAIMRRKVVVEAYLAYFESLNAPDLYICHSMYNRNDVTLNYAYFPVQIQPSPGFDRNTVYDSLKREDILTRKYFYPTITDVPIYKGLYDPGRLTRTARAAQTVLCMPVHQDMTQADIQRVLHAFDRCFRQKC